MRSLAMATFAAGLIWTASMLSAASAPIRGTLKMKIGADKMLAILAALQEKGKSQTR